MEGVEPLPLIKRSDAAVYNQYDVRRTHSLEFYGYAILISTWLVFVVSINSLFGIWKYVIYPLSLSDSGLYSRLTDIFTTIDSYILSMWSIYVVIWWWSIGAWVGLKLFRHSKGIQG